MDGKNMPLRSTSPSPPQKKKVVCSQDIATHIQNNIIIQGLHRWSSMGCEILPLVQDIIGCFGFLVKQVLFSPKLVSSAATLKLKEFYCSTWKKTVGLQHLSVTKNCLKLIARTQCNWQSIRVLGTDGVYWPAMPSYDFLKTHMLSRLEGGWNMLADPL